VARVWIGVSGWDYPEWRGTVYPPGVHGLDELAHVCRGLDTVEVNSTFYGLTTPEHVRAWYEAARPGFQFAVKGSRFLTHVKRLKDPHVPLANFLASGLLELRERLGPILWQLPATMPFDPERLEGFLALLPHDTETWGALARDHDDHVPAPAVEPDRTRPVRHVIEPRHPSFSTEEMGRLAERRGVAVAVSHSSQWPCLDTAPGPFVYVRLHGPDAVYASAYGPRRIEEWAERVRGWQEGGRDVYVYFDNTADGVAWWEATDLARRLGVGPDLG
jgi:uncharacterized protein YecE (DUF72 family)